MRYRRNGKANIGMGMRQRGEKYRVGGKRENNCKSPTSFGADMLVAVKRDTERVT